MRHRWCCVLINFYLCFSLFIVFLFRLFHFPADSISREALRCLLNKSWIYIKMNDQTEMNSLTQNTKKDTSVLWLNKGQVTNCTKNTNIYWHYNNLAKHDYHFSIEHLTYEFLSYLQKKAQNSDLNPESRLHNQTWTWFMNLTHIYGINIWTILCRLFSMINL